MLLHPVLEVSRVQKRFGPKLAVDDISFQVLPGDIFGLIGANGAGKTTLIRMITGQISPTGGNLTVGGKRADDLAAKRLVGYVPDSDMVFPKLTAREFLLFVGEIRRLPARTCRTRTEMLLDFLSLSERADTLLETFSRGMKKRIQLAAALMHNPRLLVLDEPMLGFDPEMMVVVRELLQALAGSGTAILLSTHDLPTAEQVCRSAIILHNGGSLAQGSVAEIAQRTRSASLTQAYLRLIEAEPREEDIDHVVAGLQTLHEDMGPTPDRRS